VALEIKHIIHFIRSYVYFTSDPQSDSFLLVVELERLQKGGRPLHNNSSGNRASTEDRRFADIIKEKPLKVTIRVLVPVKEHPKVSARPCFCCLFVVNQLSG
jgi:hypothetical protein